MKAGVKSGGGAALPGMIFNQGKEVTYTDVVSGADKSVYAGRLECTMQVSGLWHINLPRSLHTITCVCHSTLLENITLSAQLSSAIDASRVRFVEVF